MKAGREPQCTVRARWALPFSLVQVALLYVPLVLFLGTSPALEPADPVCRGCRIGRACFCRWVVFRGVPGINNVIIGAMPGLCENVP